MIKKVGPTPIKSKHLASCHCGSVVLELDLPDGIVNPRRCNCSLCRRKGAIVASVALSGVRIIKGQEALKLYQFNTKTAKHYFCANCGIYTHHQRRSHPDQYGYNVGCLEGVDPYDIGQIPTNDGVNHPVDQRMATIQLRPAREDERESLFAIYKTTLQCYIEGTWGWNETFQRSAFREHHPLAQFRVITVDGELAGGIHVEEQAQLNFVRMIFLLPRFQRRGIGSELLQGEAARARAAGKSLHLNVIKINPAKQLYDRMGFRVMEEDNAVYHMRLL